jgi:Uncharacterised protein family (UPF0236)
VAHGASRRLQRAICDFAADEAFGTAAEKLQEHYGLSIAVERVRRTCLHHAHLLAARAPEATGTLAAEGAAAIVAEADGTMIPTVDCTAAPPDSDRRKHRHTAWQEMRLVAARAQGEVQVQYAAGFGTAEATGQWWSEVVRRAHWAPHTFIHGVGDGAEWISEQFRQHFGAHGRYTLDLFHACDYLAAAAPTSAPAGFVAQQREALKRNEHAAVIAELATRLEAPTPPAEQTPVRAAHRYLSKRVDQLDYQAALARDLPVGSGLIESGHRHVLQARLKKPGAWWTRNNAHAVAQLRVTRANHGWHDYWAAN